MKQILSWETNVCSGGQKIPRILHVYRTWKFITLLETAKHWHSSEPEKSCPRPSILFFKVLVNINLLSTPVCSSWYITLMLLHLSTVCISLVCRVCHTNRPSYSEFDYPSIRKQYRSWSSGLWRYCLGLFRSGQTDEFCNPHCRRQLDKTTYS